MQLLAASTTEAIRLARQRGVHAISVEEEPDRPTLTNSSGKSFPLLLFSQELLALLEAGLTLVEALGVLVNKERRKDVADVLRAVTRGLQEGLSFSKVLSDQPSLFPEMFVASMKASERTGDLPRALARYIAYQAQFNEIKKKITSAAIYPSALLVVGALVCVFLVGYVLPRFSVVYDGSGREIPWLSLMLLDVGRLLHQHWVIAAIAIGTVVLLAVLAVKLPATRRALLESILRLPWLADRASEFRMIRFYRAASLLLASGIALPRALMMVEGLLSPVQRAQLRVARTGLDEGRSFSASMVEADLSSAVAESLIKVGERSGQMAEMLERTAMFHEEEMSRVIDWASRLLEPVLMAAIGIIVGAVVLLMYMPIFELAGSLQ
ncbi:type II secretion system F family protein [Piscinibacter sp. HJYY11]|uniref:type II secretion system F family protein n=1 Tax=Piscinibacter sp. HJYY11 TaxID=2801333 RepID=UPI002872D854|nr:type II secretion system F family protein [Piscinibacter sp. HJYY11]